MTKIMSILESDLGLIINPLKPSKTFMTITFRLRSHRRRRFVDDQWFFFGIEMMWTSNPNRWRRPNPTAVLNISRFTGSCIAAPFPFLSCLCYGFLVICVIRPVLNPKTGWTCWSYTPSFVDDRHDDDDDDDNVYDAYHQFQQCLAKANLVSGEGNRQNKRNNDDPL